MGTSHLNFCIFYSRIEFLSRERQSVLILRDLATAIFHVRKTNFCGGTYFLGDDSPESFENLIL